MIEERTKNIKIRMTEAELARLRDGMAASKIFNQSEFIRQAVEEKVARAMKGKK